MKEYRKIKMKHVAENPLNLTFLQKNLKLLVAYFLQLGFCVGGHFFKVQTVNKHITYKPDF